MVTTYLLILGLDNLLKHLYPTLPKVAQLFGLNLLNIRASLVIRMVKCPPAMQETPVRSLGQEDPLEKEMTTHSSTLA